MYILSSLSTSLSAMIDTVVQDNTGWEATSLSCKNQVVLGKYILSSLPNMVGAVVQDNICRKGQRILIVLKFPFHQHIFVVCSLPIQLKAFKCSFRIPIGQCYNPIQCNSMCYWCDLSATVLAGLSHSHIIYRTKKNTNNSQILFPEMCHTQHSERFIFISIYTLPEA